VCCRPSPSREFHQRPEPSLERASARVAFIWHPASQPARVRSRKVAASIIVDPLVPTGNSCVTTICRPMTRLHRWLRRCSLRLVSKIPSLYLLDPFSNRSSPCSFGSTSLFVGRPLGKSCAVRPFFLHSPSILHPTLSRFSRPTSIRNPALTTQRCICCFVLLKRMTEQAHQLTSFIGYSNSRCGYCHKKSGSRSSKRNCATLFVIKISKVSVRAFSPFSSLFGQKHDLKTSPFRLLA
jgi:hypothetical protein